MTEVPDFPDGCADRCDGRNLLLNSKKWDASGGIFLGLGWTGREVLR